jgi:uncharacterized membrane protein
LSTELDAARNIVLGCGVGMLGYIMADEPHDLSDARSRDEARTYREKFTRGASSQSEFAYIPRWIPTPSRTMTRWDLFMTCLGAVILVAVIVAVVVARFVP